MIRSLYLEPGFLEGWVKHQRKNPRPHEFQINKTWVCIDADKFANFGEGLKYWHLNGFGLHSLNRRAFLGHPGDSIRAAVERECLENDIDGPFGQILAIAACKTIGSSLNPADFYLVHDEDANLLAILANLKNSQNEHFCYVFKVEDQNHLSFECQKALYIASHTPMDVIYKWHFYIGKRHFMAHIEIQKPPNEDEPLMHSLLFPEKIKRDQEKRAVMDITMSTRLRPFTLENSNKLGLKYAMNGFRTTWSRLWNRILLNENGMGQKHPAVRGEEHPREIPPPKQIRKSRRRV